MLAGSDGYCSWHHDILASGWSVRPNEQRFHEWLDAQRTRHGGRYSRGPAEVVFAGSRYSFTAEEMARWCACAWCRHPRELLWLRVQGNPRGDDWTAREIPPPLRIVDAPRKARDSSNPNDLRRPKEADA